MKKNEVFNPDYFDSSSDDNSHKHGCLPECKDMREWNNIIQKMIDAFELMKYKKVKCGISDILNAPKRLIRIDVNDVTELFQEGGEVHIFDASVDASNENIMSLIISRIKKDIKRFEPYSHTLFFFLLPEDHPLLMEELKPFSDWIESVPGEFMVKWGMANQSTQEFRIIVLFNKKQIIYGKKKKQRLHRKLES